MSSAVLYVRIVSYSISLSTAEMCAMSGSRDKASGPLCHLPGLWDIEWSHRSVLSFNRKIRGLAIVHKSRSLKILRSGLWSVEIRMFLQPNANIREWLSAHDTASASPSVGEYLLSLGWVVREPVSSHPNNKVVLWMKCMSNVAVTRDNQSPPCTNPSEDKLGVMCRRHTPLHGHIQLSVLCSLEKVFPSVHPK